jgi:hypothetical protein
MLVNSLEDKRSEYEHAICKNRFYEKDCYKKQGRGII